MNEPYGLPEDGCNELQDYRHDLIHAYKANKNKNNPDIYTWDEAMASPHKEEWLQSAQKEIDSLVEQGTWIEVDKSTATQKIVPCQWIFREKKRSDGSHKSWKGRVVIWGDLQEDDGCDNFSPVSAWPTIRCFLMISII